jgi:hypothetical protein
LDGEDFENEVGLRGEERRGEERRDEGRDRERREKRWRFFLISNGRVRSGD